MSFKRGAKAGAVRLSRARTEPSEQDRPADIHHRGALRSSPSRPHLLHFLLTQPHKSPLQLCHSLQPHMESQEVPQRRLLHRRRKIWWVTARKTRRRVIRWLGLTQQAAILLNKNETSQRSLTWRLTDCGKLPVQKKTSTGTTGNVATAQPWENCPSTFFFSLSWSGGCKAALTLENSGSGCNVLEWLITLIWHWL